MIDLDGQGQDELPCYRTVDLDSRRLRGLIVGAIETVWKILRVRISKIQRTTGSHYRGANDCPTLEILRCLNFVLMTCLPGQSHSKLSGRRAVNLHDWQSLWH